jgi:hypothetical protein
VGSWFRMFVISTVVRAVAVAKNFEVSDF